MSNRIPQQLSLGRRVMLTVTLVAVFAAPFMSGAVRPKGERIAPEAPAAVQAEPEEPQAGLFPTAPRTEVDDVRGLGTVVASATVTVRPRIEGQLMSVTFKEGDRVQAGQLLASIDARPYQIQMEKAQSQITDDVAALDQARFRQQTEAIPQLEAKVRADVANLDTARLQLAYSEIRSPIAGIAGLRLIDPGNIVRPSDTTPIVVITQVQPVAVLFNIPEDRLPQALALLRNGSNVAVELWDHDDSVKLATGHLVAADNQIDTTTGTLKLKALFDNTDNALFPNQFVNVRLLLH
jgi:multidrug efflux system membrane fusion protein